jgi:hypothetical protein
LPQRKLFDDARDPPPNFEAQIWQTCFAWFSGPNYQTHLELCSRYTFFTMSLCVLLVFERLIT